MPSFVTGLTAKIPALKYLIEPIEKQYMDFEGKADRQQYWMFVLMQAILLIGLGIITTIIIVVLGLISGTLAQIVGIILMVLLGLLFLALALPSLAILARRLRDGGFSPWLMLLYFIGLGIVPFIMTCLPSQGTGTPAAPAGE